MSSSPKMRNMLYSGTSEQTTIYPPKWFAATPSCGMYEIGVFRERKMTPPGYCRGFAPRPPGEVVVSRLCGAAKHCKMVMNSWGTLLISFFSKTCLKSTKNYNTRARTTQPPHAGVGNNFEAKPDMAPILNKIDSRRIMGENAVENINSGKQPF